MRATFINNHGDLDQIKVEDLQIPKINPNEVLVKTKFAALNRLDLFVIKGWPGLNLSMPHILGADGSGIIEKIGSQVTTLAEGDKVTINPGLSCGKCHMCLSGNQVLCEKFSILGEFQNGTFAQYFNIPEINALKIPDDFPFDKAAAAPLTFLTAWRMVTTQAKLKPNEYVFIHGAGGGVSTAAIQIAKYLGAIVITSTSSQDKMEKAKGLGADYVINYKEMKDFSKYVYTELTKKHGIDVVIDSVGRQTFPTSMRLLRPGGRLITCGATSGPFVKIDITNIFWKHLEIKGSTMANQGEFREVMKLIFEKKLNPIIDRTFTLEQVKEAARFLEEGSKFGKVLIKIE